MALDSQSPWLFHLAQNAGLILIALLMAPITTALVVAGLIFRREPTPAHSALPPPPPHSAAARRYNVLVTGVGMSKGLFIARAFWRSGHVVVGADFEPHHVPVAGRFSRSLRRFYRLPRAQGSKTSAEAYVEALLDIIMTESIDLWVSCSSVGSALEDAEVAEAVERRTRCRAVQFGVELTSRLHEKDAFIEQTRGLGLTVPETQPVASVEAAMDYLYRGTARDDRRFITKPVRMDDVGRAEIMTRLPRATEDETRRHLQRLRISPERPFILQQFIDGPEYCTHAIVVRGRVAAFVCCRSAEILMHYEALPPSSDLARAMLAYTEEYAAKLGAVTGHFSLDFMLEGADHGQGLRERLYPIECNPRAHTAVVLFGHEMPAMVDAYLEVLSTDEDGNSTTVIPATSPRVYWTGHDLIAGAWRLDPDVWRHLLTWKDGTYETWDPWPFWWLYCVCWPATFVMSIVQRAWWSRCNVSTMKLFRCG